MKQPVSLRTAIILAVLPGPAWVLAQPSWAPAGIPFLTMEMRNIYTDTLGDAIYFCGESSIDGDYNFNDQGISVYRNGQWDTLGVFNGGAQCIVRWGDTLVVGGYFQNINGAPISHCAALVDGEWSQFGDFCCPEADPYTEMVIKKRSIYAEQNGNGGYRGEEGRGLSLPSPPLPPCLGADLCHRLSKFRIIDGELYAIGAFVEVDGHLCNGLAKRSDGQWVPVGSMIGVNPNYLSDLIKYDGHLVIAGAVGFDWTSAHGVGILNDTVWEPLGPGILGNFGQGRSLAVYQGDLYLGGAININDGNAGHGIMRWDGEQFHPVGDGLQGMYNDFSMPTGVGDMKIRNGLLYCSGQFRFAGHAPATGMATWDGTTWCGFGGDLRLPVAGFDFYHDTLFVGPFHEAEGVDVNCAAKYIGTYPDTCSQLGMGISAGVSAGGGACSRSSYRKV